MNNDLRLIELCDDINVAGPNENITPEMVVNTVDMYLLRAKNSLSADYEARPFMTDCCLIGIGAGKHLTAGRFAIGVGKDAFGDAKEAFYELDYFGLRFNYRHLLTDMDMEPTLENILARQLSN